MDTVDPSVIASTSVTLRGYLSPSFDASGATLGFIVSPTNQPTDKDAFFVQAGQPDENHYFYATASGLEQRKTYFYWSRIQTKENVWLGREMTFFTWEVLPVDIGFSVLWADYNVGATYKAPLGLYFTWGGSEGIKSQNDALSDKWEAGNGFIKYNSEDGKKTLDPEDDIAQVLLGGSWRMPTFDETQELVRSTNNPDYKWTHTTLEGVPGWEVEYLPNGNRIFFPALKNEGTSYWSSNCYGGTSNYAWGFCFSDSDVGPLSLSSSRRSNCLIRAVMAK